MIRLTTPLVLCLSLLVAGPAVAGYYNSQGQWCEGANNTLCEGASNSSSSGGTSSAGSYDPDAAMANALGQVLGVLLNAVIEESAKADPPKSSGTTKRQGSKNPPFCTGTLCYPKGDPAKYPVGSRGQFEAVCAMSNAENTLTYLNYRSIAECTDKMMEVASYSSAGAFSNFAGSALPGPDAMLTVPELPPEEVSDEASTSAGEGDQTETTDDADTERQGSACVSGWEGKLQCQGKWATGSIYDVYCANTLPGTKMTAWICKPSGECQSTYDVEADGKWHLVHNNLGERNWGPRSCDND